MYVPLGVTGQQRRLGLTKIGNSPFDLSVTRVGNPKISQHLQFQKSENVYILQLNIIEYYTTLFDFENSISANCIEGTLHEEQKG